MDNRGISNVISSVFLILVVIIVIVILGVMINNISNSTDNSITASKCKVSNFDNESYKSCVVKEVSAQYALDNGIITKEEFNQYTLSNQNNEGSFNPPFTQYCNTSLISGLVGYFCFEGNTLDSSGMGNNGYGNISYENLSNGNIVGKFNGINEYFKILESASLNNNQFSVGFWVRSSKPEEGAPHALIDRYVLSKGYLRSNKKSGLADYDLFFSDTNRNMRTIDRGVRNNLDFDAGYYGSNRGWHQVIITRDSANFKVYVDEILRDIKPIAIHHNSSINFNISDTIINGIYIGKSAYLENSYFEGNLDNIMIYNRLLSESEITTLYSEQIKILNNSYNNSIPSNQVAEDMCYIDLVIKEVNMSNGIINFSLVNSTSFEGNYSDDVFGYEMFNDSEYVLNTMKNGDVVSSYALYTSRFLYFDSTSTTNPGGVIENTEGISINTIPYQDFDEIRINNNGILAKIPILSETLRCYRNCGEENETTTIRKVCCKGLILRNIGGELRCIRG